MPTQEEQSAFDEGFQRGRADMENLQHQAQLNLLADSFKNLQMEMRAQGISTSVSHFSGEGAQKFSDWMADVTKVQQTLQGDDERMRTVTLQTLQGAAGSFAARLITDEPNITWARLKQELTKRYSDLADAQFARQALRRKLQRKGQSIQSYYEELLAAAKLAYVGEDLNQSWVQTILTEIFIDGVRSDATAKMLIRKQPRNLEAAYIYASQEAQAARTFELRRGTVERQEEAMEIDNFTGPSGPPPANNEALLARIAQLEQLIPSLQPSHQPQPHQASTAHGPRAMAVAGNVGWGRPYPVGPRPLLRPPGFTSGPIRSQNPHMRQGRGPPLAQPMQWPSRTERPGWSAQGEPLCFHCGSPGHFVGRCPTHPKNL